MVVVQSNPEAAYLVKKWAAWNIAHPNERQLFPMRQWMVPPSMLCQQHLLGERAEHHMFVGTIRRRTSLSGYIEGGLVEVHNIRARHEELTVEMLRRGYNHRSPLPEFEAWEEGEVDADSNVIELMERCERCKQRILTMEHGS